MDPYTRALILTMADCLREVQPIANDDQFFRIRALLKAADAEMDTYIGRDGKEVTQ